MWAFQLGGWVPSSGLTLGWSGAAITPNQRSRVNCLPDPFAQMLVLTIRTPGEWRLNVDLFKVSLLGPHALDAWINDLDPGSLSLTLQKPCAEKMHAL